VAKTGRSQTTAGGVKRVHCSGNGDTDEFRPPTHARDVRMCAMENESFTVRLGGIATAHCEASR